MKKYLNKENLNLSMQKQDKIYIYAVILFYVCLIIAVVSTLLLINNMEHRQEYEQTKERLNQEKIKFDSLDYVNPEPEELVFVPTNQDKQFIYLLNIVWSLFLGSIIYAKHFIK